MARNKLDAKTAAGIGPIAIGDGMSELTRIKTFIGLQVFFLAITPFAGGFNNEVWSMLDSAILVLSIGVTGMMLVLETKQARMCAFKVALCLYLLSVLDISINILLTGWVGWQSP